VNHKVFAQDWEESERGWGVRPDGTSLHLTEQDVAEYVQTYYRTFNSRGAVSDEYTRTSGEAYEIEVTEEIYQELLVQAARVGEPLSRALRVHRVTRSKDKNGFTVWTIVRYPSSRKDPEPKLVPLDEVLRVLDEELAIGKASSLRTIRERIEGLAKQS
jgi:hypothetical protein